MINDTNDLNQIKAQKQLTKSVLGLMLIIFAMLSFMMYEEMNKSPYEKMVADLEIIMKSKKVNH